MRALALALVLSSTLACAADAPKTPAPPTSAPLAEADALKLENGLLRQQAMLERAQRLQAEAAVLQASAESQKAEVQQRQKDVIRAAGMDPATATIDLPSRTIKAGAP